MLVTRCPPCVEPDRHVIKQLLAIDPEAESGKAPSDGHHGYAFIAVNRCVLQTPPS